jgi:hypothetical protein
VRLAAGAPVRLLRLELRLDGIEPALKHVFPRGANQDRQNMSALARNARIQLARFHLVVQSGQFQSRTFDRAQSPGGGRVAGKLLVDWHFKPL